MAVQGIVVDVDIEEAQTALVADAAAGATVLEVANAVDFDTAGGQLTVTQADETDDIQLELAFTVVSDDLTEITLADPLPVDLVAGATIAPLPAPTYTIATVVTDDDQPPLECPILHTLKSSTLMQPGPRPDGTGETVVVDFVNGKYTVVDIVGQPADEIVTDPWGTTPPDAAPVLAVAPFAAGAVQGDWEPVDGAQGYRVHVSMTSPVPLDGSALVAITGGTRYTVSDLGGAPLPLDGSPVYMVVEPVNPNGVGPVSNEDSAVPRTADELISALFIYSNKIQAGQIDSGAITADIAWVGGSLTVGDPGAMHIVVDPMSGLVLYGNDGVTPEIELRIDGQPSVFRGRIITSDITVLNGALLQGEENTLAVNAVFTLQDSVPDPAAEPALGVGAASRPYAAPSGGYQDRGVFWTGTEWLQMYYSPASVAARVRAVDPTTGAAAASILLERPDSQFNITNGLVQVGSYLYTYWKSGGWFFAKIDASTGEVVWVGGVTGVDTDTGYPTVGIDHTAANRVVVAVGDEVLSLDVSGTYASVVATYTFSGGTPPFSPTEKLTYVGRGNFDYGAERVVIATTTKFYAFSRAGTVLTLVHEWDIDGTSWGGAWDGTNFFTVHNNGTLKRYSDWKGAGDGSDRRVWVQTTDGITVPSETETGASPAESILLPDRRYLTMTAAGRSPLATHTGFYVGYTASGGAQPARTSMHRSDALTTGLSKTISTKVTAGDNPPAASEFAAGGDPGLLKSQSGGLELHGDGTVKAPKKLQAGDISVTFASTTSALVGPFAFDQPFDEPPAVCANVDVASAATNRWTVKATAVDENGFTLGVYNPNGAAAGAWTGVPVSWIAVAKEVA